MSDNTNMAVNGSIITQQGEQWYRIDNVQHMRPFFINIATNSDIWMFLSSTGALTAGRGNADKALFPYETDDRIHLSTSTGPKTLIRVGDKALWQPFDMGYVSSYKIRRSLSKNLTCSAVLFEEINETLGLAFTYRWDTSEKFGIVRTATLRNLSGESLSLSILDGVENVMPYGVPLSMSQGSSCLADAYKTADAQGKIAVFALSSKINDSPVPYEVLNANVAWSTGSYNTLSLSSDCLRPFAEGVALTTDVRVTGRKTAYFTQRAMTLAADAEQCWMLVLDACKNQLEIGELEATLDKSVDIEAELAKDIAASAKELRQLIALSDGLQCTGDEVASAHHYMNVLYNNMRGGVFPDGYRYNAAEFVAFADSYEKGVTARHPDFFAACGQDTNVIDLKNRAYATGDAALIRLTLEFLPLSFSRRHGDPSRPWNRFSIRVKDEEGQRIYAYEGNWRDIFQNWEAMCLSFPGYLENVIAKFLNASTMDGFNPYRLTSGGVDWEVPEPSNPFGGLGYWGDHQIVYLTRLLEALNNHDPAALNRMMSLKTYCYANVPYRILSYANICADAKNTIRFDRDLHNSIMEQVGALGADAKLVRNANGVVYVSFAEKLLVPILSKLSNLVVGGGIWMNTQRPEWNDANNAIVGIGLSMVTVYQLYRHLLFCQKLFTTGGSAAISVEVVDWLRHVDSILHANNHKLGHFSGTDSRQILDSLGQGFSTYRDTVYAGGLSSKSDVSYQDIANFFATAIAYLADTIKANKTEDGLYNAYNLLRLTDNSLETAPLFPMLEGQTAALGAQLLGADEALKLIETMESSGLYSPDHGTFYLYPIKNIPPFMAKNIIPADQVQASRLLTALLATGHKGIVARDVSGNVRFHEQICSFGDLRTALDSLATDTVLATLATEERSLLLDIFDLVFKHSAFTGRSGIMYKYEGIGCIYWHQNSKFLLSVQETLDSTEQADAPALKDAYYRVREGLGFTKSPDLWGAFPLEPYSHSPYQLPAQQPGMTGQVKEEILTRRRELGLDVQAGTISFGYDLLRRGEFLAAPACFTYMAVDGSMTDLPLAKDSLAYTLCQVPVVLELSDSEGIVLTCQNGQEKAIAGLTISTEDSAALFNRTGAITKVTVKLNVKSVN